MTALESQLRTTSHRCFSRLRCVDNRISCFGAETNTAAYDKDVHITRAGANIPVMMYGNFDIISLHSPFSHTDLLARSLARACAMRS